MQKLFLFFFVFISGQSLYAQDSLDIKIGQMIMVGIYGTSVNEDSAIIQDIKKGIVGGILLYERNLNPINTATNVMKLTSDLQSASSIPLLISIDQEGGKVNRLKEKYGFKPMPSAKSVGEKHDDTYTLDIANTIASTLADCGINLNYAPVLDIDNPACPVLGKKDRCYSSKPDSIAYMASMIIEAHHRHGVQTALKHFPGHGNSTTDSHLGMTDVTKTWKEEELSPYQKLIDEGKADAIMTGHIVNQKLDSTGMPATLSKKIITGLLRNQMGYQGVVISDDMQMHAISNYYNFEESIAQCINAGVDILMFSNNISGTENYSPMNVYATIKRLVLEEKISMSRINESFDRIMKMKGKK